MPSLNTVIKQASRGADLYFVFRFLRLLTMDYKKTNLFINEHIYINTLIFNIVTY